MHVVLEIPGKPQAKGRPRFTSMGHAYTPTPTREAEKRIVAAWLEQYGNQKPHDGAVALEVITTFEPPKSWSKQKRAQALAGEVPHLVKPDIDNLIKLVKDALNGFAYLDDSQVTRVGGSKQYGTKNSTTLLITFTPTERTTNE